MIDAILKRVSTRTFHKETFSEQEITKINEVVLRHHKIKGSFNNLFEFTFNLNDSQVEGGRKISTYGLIKNVPAFIGAASENSFESIIDFGFVFENLILSLTKLGYDTCWLAGSFKKSDYRKSLLKDEIIPAISPVGHKSRRRSLADMAIRTFAQSKNRLDYSILFKYYETELPYDMTKETIITQCLDLVRVGPSAANKQPWRLYIDGDKIHFYIERTDNYPSKSLGYDIQALDMGIAINHFSHGLNNFNKSYSYIKFQNLKEFTYQDYIISITISK